MKEFLKRNFELLIWISGLAFLYFVPANQSLHFTFCIFSNLGFEYCPGCGIGESISYLMKLRFIDSFNAHPFGIPAFMILMHRIILLLRNNAMLFNPSADNIINHFPGKRD